MKSYLGIYQAPGIEAEATILVFDKNIHIGFRDNKEKVQTFVWELSDIATHYNPADQSSKLRNIQTNGPVISIAGKAAAEQIIHMQEETRKPWFKKQKTKGWTRGMAIIFIFLVFLAMLYFFLVPWVSEKLASRVPVSTEEQFGDVVYESLQLGEQEDSSASYVINHFFATMEIPTEYRIRISVVKSETINAFALPGGRIIVYDGLLKKLGSYPELSALLAHEFVHVNNRHATRSIFRRLGSRVFISLLLGDFGAVTSVLADQADHIKQLGYSRALEKEADITGLELLMERGIDPRGFTELFHHLQQSNPNSEAPEMLTSHPDISKRIEYLSSAANKAQPREHLPLKLIFENLKKTIQP
jgi:Zn-dependent protease with chaperone function